MKYKWFEFMKNFQYFEKYLVLTIIILLAVFLFQNINYFPSPAGDFFSFVSDGRNFLKLSLPEQLKFPPLYSILMVFLGKFINYPYPELWSGIIINIIFFSLSIYFFWLISKKHFGSFSVLLLFLVIFNPLTFFVVLHPWNIVSFTLVVLISLNFRNKNQIKKAYITAGIGYLVRPEIMALIVAMGFIDLLTNADKKKIIKYLLFSLVPVVLYELSVSLHNQTGNLYFTEIFSRKDEIPNWYFYYSTLSILFYKGFWIAEISKNGYLGLYILPYTCLGIFSFIYQKNKEMLVISLYTFLYFIIHFIFPGYGDRYSYPIIFSLYTIGFWPVFVTNKRQILSKSKLPIKIIFSIFTFLLLIHNGKGITEFMSARKYELFESYLSAQYLNQQIFLKPTLVLTYDPGENIYFNHNPKVHYIFYKDNSDSLEAIVQEQKINPLTTDVLFIYDSHVAHKFDGYFDNYGILNLFKNFEKSPEIKNWQLLTILTSTEANIWVKIYKYKPIFSYHQS